MAEPTKRLIHDGFFRKDVKIRESEKIGVKFMLNIDQIALSDEQIGKLLDILDRAADEAEAVLEQ